jgi:hypothetical protein
MYATPSHVSDVIAPHISEAGISIIRKPKPHAGQELSYIWADDNRLRADVRVADHSCHWHVMSIMGP